jgi:hypothetical protein
MAIQLAIWQRINSFLNALACSRRTHFVFASMQVLKLRYCLGGSIVIAPFTTGLRSFSMQSLWMTRSIFVTRL